MSEILIGVIIGGLIASISPVFTLVIDHRRWKRESKLTYLMSERKNLETLYSKNLRRFSKAIAENSFSSDMISEFLLIDAKGSLRNLQSIYGRSGKNRKKMQAILHEPCPGNAKITG